MTDDTYNRGSKRFVLPLGVKILFDGSALVHFITINGKYDIGIAFA